MTDALGWRAKFGVLVPSTNTSVQPEFDAMRPAGITNHVGRIPIPNMRLADDADFLALITAIEQSLLAAIDPILSCAPDHIVLGMSAETFWDGRDASDELKAALEARAGMGVTLGSHACRAAIACYPGVKRLGIITPYQPIGDQQVRRFFTECGFEVAALEGLKCVSPTDIAHVSDARLQMAADMVNAAAPDLIMQVGTNLAFAAGAATAERRLGKPVLAINTCTYWHALRTQGFTDRQAGFGSLLRDF